MTEAPRIAYFADSFHEVNGVAHTSRMIKECARRNKSRYMVVNCGPRTVFSMDGPVWQLELKRGRASFALDSDLFFDVNFQRYRKEIEEKLKLFAPDAIHVTGPSDVGIMGALLAKSLHLPLVASWHTNLHEYAGRRLEKMLPFLPKLLREGFGSAAEGGSMRVLGFFYHLADVVMAPNPELLKLVEEASGRPGFLMRRGVDTQRFSPCYREREDETLILGFVGRLTVEKNIYLLARVEDALRSAGIEDYKLLLIGEGIEREKLRSMLRKVEMPGVYKGEALSRAYANMDIFVFPSRTDTFGNVVLEALSSGVPAVVTADGGPKFIVRSHENGFVAADDEAFLKCVIELANSRALRAKMSHAARRQAMETTWDDIWKEMVDAWRSAANASR